MTFEELMHEIQGRVQKYEETGDPWYLDNALEYFIYKCRDREFYISMMEYWDIVWQFMEEDIC